MSYQDEVTGLIQRVNVTEKGFNDISRENCRLSDDIFTQRATLRNEMIDIQAENAGLRASNDSLRAANESLDHKIVSLKKGRVGSLRVAEPKSNGSVPETVASSLATALKAANARAAAVQFIVNSLQADIRGFREQPRDLTYYCDLQASKQVEHLQQENRVLREATGDAEKLNAQLKVQYGKELQVLEKQYADKIRELELGFNEGFQNLRALRDQWLSQKRCLEEEHYSKVVAADHQHKLERQASEAKFEATCKEKEGEIERKNDELLSQKNDLALQASKTQSSGEAFAKMQSRAEEAEKKERELRIAAAKHGYQQGLMKQTLQNLKNQGLNLRQDRKRQLDLLNEEVLRMALNCRESELHRTLQDANHSLDILRDHLDNGETDSKALRKCLYGAEFNLSDERLLESQIRPVLLAQLQGAKKLLRELTSFLAKGPNVDISRVISILEAPRGDEDAGEPVEDIFDELQQPTPQALTRKRTGAPLYAPSSGEHDEKFAYDDWGDTTVDTGAELRTREEISNRKTFTPKTRRNGPSVDSIPPEHKEPAIRDH